MEPEVIDFKNESNRLATFIGWPVSFIITPKSLAAAGFYYTKHTDKVKCAFCNIYVCRWEFGDNAMDEHKRHNPDCSFILSHDCGNIPIIEGIQLRGEFVENHKETGEPIDIRGLGIRAHRVALHLKYNSYSSRIKTFRRWENESQKPEDLAIAGFFFTGNNDEVRCYYCDGGLQNWEEADNPWVEHAKWFPNCDFLKLVKGEKFLDGSLVERFNALLVRPRSDDPTSSSSSQEGQVVSIHQTDDLFQNLPSRATTLNRVSDQVISEFMSLPPATSALELGLQPSQIRQAIRSNLQDLGRPFRSTDSFIQQVLTQDQTSFSAFGDSMTLQEILRREGPMIGTNFPHDTSSEDSHDMSENDDELEDSNLEDSNFEDSNLEDSNLEDSNLEDSNLEDSNLEEFISEPQNHNITISQNENETYDINESAIVDDIVQCSRSINTNIEEEVSVTSVDSESARLSHLEEENRRLKEARLCKICLDQELGVVMLPCAHLVACITCASSLPDCPLCRQTIKATVRTFLS